MTFILRTEQALSADQQEERKLQQGMFPNQIALGSFTPHSTLVEVGCFHTDTVQQAMKAQNLMPVRQDIQVLCHEMTHWLDFFGTMWGREYIGAICRGYRAVARGTEDEFPKVIELFDQDRKVLSPAYYKFSNAPTQPHDMSRPWSLQYVTGVEIDPFGKLREDKPIFMTKFGENPSERVFARQPISIGSLLEVRAIASEIGAALSAINSNPDQDEALVEASLANREFNDLAYDHQLIEYNAAMHMLSLECGSKELFLSARLASALAFVALNLCDEHFAKIKVPESFNDFGKRNRVFKKNRDRGFAFACLVFNGGKYQGDETDYIEGCLSSSNLGSVAKVFDDAANELGQPFRFSNGNAATDHFMMEASKSKGILEAIAKLPQHMLTLNELLGELAPICPPFIDSEGNFVELSENRFDGYRPVEMHDASHVLREYTRNLLTGCRGI